MRCREARQCLDAQRRGGLEKAQRAAFQEHMHFCADCSDAAQQQEHGKTVFHSSAPLVRASISTDQIMLAVQQQRRITSQFEDMRRQQQSRVTRMRPVGAAAAALGIFTLSSLPLLAVALLLLQTDLAINMLSPLKDVIDVFFILAQYLQTGLSVLSYNNWVLSGVAFVVVIMMGMWLRLMRPPQEA